MTEIVAPEECSSSEITCRKYQRVYWEKNMIQYIDYNTKYDFLDSYWNYNKTLCIAIFCALIVPIVILSQKMYKIDYKTSGKQYFMIVYET